MMMHDFALPGIVVLGAAVARNCKNAGNETPHISAVVASQLRRVQRLVTRSKSLDGSNCGIARSQGVAESNSSAQIHCPPSQHFRMQSASCVWESDFGSAKM